MKLEVDWTRCDGHGLCARLLSEQVSLDDWGFPIVSTPEVEPSDERHARRAVAVCPRLALRLSAPAR